jgi:hypothetical protein
MRRHRSKPDAQEIIMKYNKEQMARDILSVKKILENKEELIEETLKVEIKTLSRVETIYLTKKNFYLKNVLFPKYFYIKLITWSFLTGLIK